MRTFAKFGLATALVTSALAADLLLTLSALSSADAQVRSRPPESLDWQTFLVPEFGTTVDYPAGVFSVPDGKADKGFGQRFNSADGRAVLTIYTRENEEGDTPATYLTPHFFAISSERQGLILYSRCNFSTDAGGAIHCFDLIYPRAEKRAWDAIVTRISRSLRPLEG